MDVDILEDTKPITNENGDHERFAHWVYKRLNDPRSIDAIIMEAMVNGTPVEALCGKVWVPTRDPQRFPVCPDCQKVKDELNKRLGPWRNNV